MPRIASIILASLTSLAVACGDGDAALPEEVTSSPSPEAASAPTGEEQIFRADFEDPWPFLDLVGAGLLACEEDGSITFTPPAGGETYAVNRIAQEAGYADIEEI